VSAGLDVAAGTRAAVERFDDAFDRQDVAALAAATTGDRVFESTTPPDGERFQGPAVVEFFATRCSRAAARGTSRRRR
jgi:ketosteroid isomerase-like protein